jgi:hypothetical protein
VSHTVTLAATPVPLYRVPVLPDCDSSSLVSLPAAAERQSL